MEVGIDHRVLNGLRTKLYKAIEDIPKEVDRLNHKYDKKVFLGLRKIARSAIKDFYHSYPPHVYKRKGDLYNVFEITAKDGKWDIQVGPQFMKKWHKASHDYIYWMTMIRGSHGGGYREELDDFYWRKPFPEYIWWDDYPTSHYAGLKENTEQDIIDWANEFMDYMASERQQEFDKKMNKVLDDIKDSVRRLFT